MRCHLWIYAPGEDGLLRSVVADPEAIGRLIARARDVWACVETDDPPALIDRDTVVRADPEWVAVAAAYRKAEAVVTDGTKALEAARRILKPAHSADIHVESRVAIGDDVEARAFLIADERADRVGVLLAKTRVGNRIAERALAYLLGVPGRARQRSGDGRR